MFQEFVFNFHYYTDYNVKKAVGTLLSQRDGRNVYVVGSANVGKSKFIRALLKEMRKFESNNFDPGAAAHGRFLPMESAMPGTTLGLIPLSVIHTYVLNYILCITLFCLHECVILNTQFDYFVLDGIMLSIILNMSPNLITLVNVRTLAELNKCSQLLQLILTLICMSSLYIQYIHFHGKNRSLPLFYYKFFGIIE